MTFEYRCVAGPTIVAVKSAKARDQAVKAFEEIMNAQAREGWEYVGIDEFHVSEPQGLLSRKRIYVPSKILVFRRMTAEAKAAAQVQAQAQIQPPAQPRTFTPPPPAAAYAPIATPAPVRPAAAPAVPTEAPAAEETKDSQAFREAMQAMTEKLKAARG
jgi:hypothetical protein